MIGQKRRSRSRKPLLDFDIMIPGESNSVENDEARLFEALDTLRRAGWAVEVDADTKRILLTPPCPDENWLHSLRETDGETK
jgi:hypothetical protein